METIFSLYVTVVIQKRNQEEYPESKRQKTTETTEV